MKNTHFLFSALLASLTLPNHADALNWPTCPTAAQISQSNITGVAFSDGDTFALRGTSININNQTWYVYVGVHATNNKDAFQKAQNALHAIIDNPYEHYEENAFGCMYNTTINYSTQVGITTSPINFSLYE